MMASISLYDKWIAASALLLLIISGLFEGLSIIAILPVITLALGQGTTEQSSEIEVLIQKTLEYIGIPPNLEILLGLVVIGIALKAIFLFAANWVAGFAAVNYAAHKRQELVSTMMKSKWRYFVQKSTGRISTALTSESNQITALYMAVITFYATLIQAGIYTGIAAFTSWKMLIGSLAVGLFIVLILKGIMRQSRKAALAELDSMKNLNENLIGTLQILKPLKAMAREGQIKPLLTRDINKLKKARHHLVIFGNIIKLSQEPILTFFLAIGIYVLVSYLPFDQSYILFVAILYHRMVSRIGTAQTTFQKVYAQQDAFWSVQTLIEEFSNAEEDIKERGIQKTLKSVIQLKNVAFSYDKNIVLKNINAEFPAHKLISITGPSGAGKTTLIDLLVGLHLPTQGKILIDGEDIRNINLISWRQKIGFVPQEGLLINDTLQNNLTLYDSSISEARLIEALKKSEAWTFVQEMPEGLQTRVGERGERLSGGQRQRISIARSLVFNPDLLILDEPTSALDPETEKELCNTLKKLSQKTTIIVISHQERISEISDIVYKITDGQLTLVKGSIEKAA